MVFDLEATVATTTSLLQQLYALKDQNFANKHKSAMDTLVNQILELLPAELVSNNNFEIKLSPKQKATIYYLRGKTMDCFSNYNAAAEEELAKSVLYFFCTHFFCSHSFFKGEIKSILVGSMECVRILSAQKE